MRTIVDVSSEMKWFAADIRARLLLFTAWNTAFETKLFPGLLRSLKYLYHTHPRTLR